MIRDLCALHDFSSAFTGSRTAPAEERPALKPTAKAQRKILETAG